MKPTNESALNIIANMRKRAKLKKLVASEMVRHSKKWNQQPGARTNNKLDAKIKKIAGQYKAEFGGKGSAIVMDFFNKAKDSRFSSGIRTSTMREETEMSRLSFQDFVQNGELDERLIMLNNGSKYNQVLILGGGAGSGKGFALSNFVDSSNFKVRDVDEIKRLMQKLSAAGKIDVKKIWSTDSKSKSKLNPAALKKVGKVLSLAHYKLENLDLRIPEHVFTLHIITDIMGWKKNSLAALSKSIPEDSKHKPNIVFDITAKDMPAVERTVEICLDMGYDPKDIHLVWVLTDYNVAIKNNLGRARVVPNDILLQTHEGAAETMTDVIGGKAPRGLDGSIWTVLNNKENTIFWATGDGKLKGTPEFHQSSDNQKSTAKVDQTKYDRIYGAGAFVKRNNRSGGKFEKEKIVVKSFSRIQIKKPGKTIGNGVLPFKEQIYNWVIKNVPSSAQNALRIGFGVLLGKSGGS